MHRQGSNPYHEARPGKIVAPMVPQHMTDVLAQEAFNTLVEFLQAVDVVLLHTIRTIGPTRLGLPSGNWSILVMHIKRGLPLTSALHEPHFPALQFHRTARSFA